MALANTIHINYLKALNVIPDAETLRREQRRILSVGQVKRRFTEGATVFWYGVVGACTIAGCSISLVEGTVEYSLKLAGDYVRRPDGSVAWIAEDELVTHAPQSPQNRAYAVSSAYLLPAPAKVLRLPAPPSVLALPAPAPMHIGTMVMTQVRAGYWRQQPYRVVAIRGEWRGLHDGYYGPLWRKVADLRLPEPAKVIQLPEQKTIARAA